MCMQGQGHGQGPAGGHHGGCGCHETRGEVGGGRYENLVQPILLLLLCEKSAHGYELIERMSGFGLDFPVEPTTVYRYLRRFEEQGFVTSHWETQDAGPARRLYEITPEGKGYFKAWMAVLRKRKDLLDFILARGEDAFDLGK